MDAHKHMRQTIVRLLSNMASAKEIQQYLKRFSKLDAKRFAVVKVGGAVLRDDLEALTPALSRRCTDAMYADPFWQARFGQRGRHHADEDSGYHVRYL